MQPGRHHLESVGISTSTARPPSSSGRFPDGGAWRIEIPSVEGPEPLEAMLDEATRLEVPVHRASQGGGVKMLDKAEIADMMSIADERGVELSLFLGPRDPWVAEGSNGSPSSGLGPCAGGVAQLGQCLDDAVRAAELGVRTLLVSDEGVLWAAHRLRAQGGLPADLRLRISVPSGPVNPATCVVWAGLGADSVDVPGNLTAAQIAELRAASPVVLDFYLVSPSDVGGFMRLYDGPELIRVGAPIYLKFGLRNFPSLHPVGRHPRTAVVQSAHERVRRARLALDIIARSGGSPSPMSEPGDPRPPVPPRLTFAS